MESHFGFSRATFLRCNLMFCAALSGKDENIKSRFYRIKFVYIDAFTSSFVTFMHHNKCGTKTEDEKRG